LQIENSPGFSIKQEWLHLIDTCMQVCAGWHLNLLLKEHAQR
jgi:hypothetical protein